MNTSVSWSRTWLLAFSSLILIIMFGGCGELAGPQTNNKAEPYEIEKPDLETISKCDSIGSGGVIKAVSKTAETVTVISASGDTIQTKPFDKDTVSVAVPDGNTTYDVVASNRGGTTKSSASFDCEDVPLQPGLSFDTKCDVSDPGKLIVNAANGLTYYQLVYLETGEVVKEKSDITPEEDQVFEFQDLDDGDYRFVGKLNGEKGTLEPSFSCDGPGQITIDDQCEAEQGNATAIIENGARSWSLFYDGDKIDGETGLTPSENQEIDLGDDLDDGPYTLRANLNGNSNEKEFEIDCDKPGPGEIDVDPDCVSEDGKFRVTSSDGFEKARVFDENGNLIKEKTGFDPENNPEAIFTGLPDGELTVEVERNEKTSDDQEVVDCDGPETPTLISNECSVEYDGILTFEVDPQAEEFELRDADTDEVVRDGSVDGRDELEFSGLADGDYYLVLFRNGIEAQSDIATVKCDLITRKCVFTFDGYKFVDGFDKFFIEPLSNEKKVIFTFNPVETPRMKVDIRLSQGDQIKEAYAIGFVADGDTVFTQIRPDQDNSGSGERWLTDQFEMDQETIDQLEVGKAYKVIGVHGGYLDDDIAIGGGQSVVFSTQQPTGEDGETGGRIVIESDKTP